MKTMFLATAMIVMGCTDREPAPIEAAISGPPAADVERALASAWDPGMQPQTRPRISWVDNTACAMQRTLAAAELQKAPACDDVAFDSNGVVTVGWHKGQRISATGLGLGLAQWKVWLWASSVKDSKLISDDRIWFDAQIAAAGL